MSNLEQALVAAEEARALAAIAARDASEGWEARFDLAQQVNCEAIDALCAELERMGVPVDRVVEVLR